MAVFLYFLHYSPAKSFHYIGHSSSIQQLYNEHFILVVMVNVFSVLMYVTPYMCSLALRFITRCTAMPRIKKIKVTLVEF